MAAARIGAFIMVVCLSGCQPSSTISSVPHTATATPPQPGTPFSAPTPAAPAATVVVTAVWTPPPRTKTSGCLSHGGLPDPACTPGAVDPRVSQSNVNSTICTRGYTATVRPPGSVTEPIKRERMAAYGLQAQRLADVELDHDIPLELGGNPQDLANLWPQFWNGEANAHMKDAVEAYLNREVCRGGMPLAEARRQIATDWLSVYRSRGLSPAQ